MQREGLGFGMTATNICVVKGCMDLVSAREPCQRQLCVEDLALLSNDSCWELNIIIGISRKDCLSVVF